MKKNKTEKMIALILSLMLSIIICSQIIIDKNNLQLKFISNINILSFILMFIVVGGILYFLLVNIFIKVPKFTSKGKAYSDKQIKKLFFISFISFIIIWAICFITFYPGGAIFDTYNELQSPIYASSTHPIGYSFILYFFIIILGYRILNNAMIGWAIFSILQMIIVALSLSFALCFLAKRKCPKYIIIILSILFAILPVYATYSMFAVKDVLFAMLMLYLFLMLIKVVETNGEILKSKYFLIFYLIFGLGLLLTRNNGIIVYLLTIIIMLVLYHKQLKIYLCFLFLLPILLNFTLNFVIEKKFGVEHLFQESVAIPLQQMAASIKVDGKINKADEDYLNKLMPISMIKEKYSFGSADSIKWDDNFNRQYLQKTKGTFIKTWFSMLPANFQTYVESYLLQTYYFWNIKITALETNMFYDTHTDQEGEYVELIKTTFNLKQNDILPEPLQSKLEIFYHKYSNFLGEGLMFWLSIIIMFIIILKNKWQYFLINIPVIASFISIMLATPTNTSLRYVLYLIYILPILLGYVFTKKDGVIYESK